MLTISLDIPTFSGHRDNLVNTYSQVVHNLDGVPPSDIFGLNLPFCPLRRDELSGADGHDILQEGLNFSATGRRCNLGIQNDNDCPRQRQGAEA